MVLDSAGVFYGCLTSDLCKKLDEWIRLSYKGFVNKKQIVSFLAELKLYDPDQRINKQ